jgi:hypothetical protein
MSDTTHKSAAGHAALSICESLLISIRELQVMSEQDVRDLLEDAATTHHEASRDSDEADLHEEVAIVIERFIARR